jgi:hypothetical protein
MTCRQVRQLLAAYRRDDCSPAEHAEIEAHLQGCAECRAVDAEFRRVGESIKALPQLAPPPDFFARVMAAVQADEVKATQQTKVAEKKPETVVVPGLTNISHFPRLRRAVAERKVRLAPMRQASSPAQVFALRYTMALAATFLIFALSSVALLQLLGNPGGSGVIKSGIYTPQLLTSAFTSDSAYSVVADATASPDGRYIVYAAHTPQGSWMLEELDRQTTKSTALLSAPVSGPITIEGWARSWVLWTQGDPAGSEHWQLYATELTPALPGATAPLQLLKGGLSGQDGAVLELHGVYASGSKVLLAEQLKDEIGQLVQLDLTQADPSARTVLATAPKGHWIADPTTDGTSDYWAEEWLDSDGTPHGDIMRLTPDSEPGSITGSGVSLAPAPEAITSNGVSFAPMVTANKLVWLEGTSQEQAQIHTTGPTPTATPSTQTTLTPGGGSVSHVTIASGTLWSEAIDPNVSDLDSGARSKIADGVSMPQAGATFVTWQDSKGDFYLYDVANDVRKPLNSTISNALVLAVSPTAVLWVTPDSQLQGGQLPSKTTINVLDWPQR